MLTGPTDGESERGEKRRGAEAQGRKGTCSVTWESVECSTKCSIWRLGVDGEFGWALAQGESVECSIQCSIWRSGSMAGSVG